ncbi:MAG: PEP-CTERM sorting domain-containing protein [Chthoniobacterales bacterium]
MVSATRNTSSMPRQRWSRSGQRKSAARKPVFFSLCRRPKSAVTIFLQKRIKKVLPRFLRTESLGAPVENRIRNQKIKKTFMKKLTIAAAALMALALTSTVHAQVLITAWDFFGQAGSQATQAPGTASSDLDVSSVLSRGLTAAGSAGANSFRTTGFRNDGIAVTNTDYFEFSLSASAGNTMSLTSIMTRTSGTATFDASPGVSQQFAYSLDGGLTFTLIGSPVVVVGGAMQSTFDLSTTAALQNLSASTTVTLRYYASGQTSTGGWGFFSSASGDAGLAVFGTGVAAAPPLPMVPEPATYMLFGMGLLVCVQQFRRRRATASK